MLKATSRLGFWSSVLSAVFSVLWVVTFNLRDVLGSVPDWHDLEAYAAAFSPARMLYIYPSLLLAVSFVVVMACINYNMQAAAVRQSLAAGETAGWNPGYGGCSWPRG